jgi:ATP-binding cassette subfamily F protein uup
MLQPADLLLLDEPTNDLDIPTLETLEETLLDFPGAVVLITHDRCMLDRICNNFLALGNPNRPELFADLSQWQMKSLEDKPQTKEKKKEETPQKAKLSYTEKKEYEQIEGKISKLEAEIKEFNALLEQDEITKDPVRLKEVCTAVSIRETQIEQLYLRWEELDKKTT